MSGIGTTGWRVVLRERVQRGQVQREEKQAQEGTLRHAGLHLIGSPTAEGSLRI